MSNFAVINVCSDGSTGKITTGLFKYLQKKGFNSFFFYSRGPILDEKNAIKFESSFEIMVHAALGRLTGLQGFFSYFATRKLIGALKRKSITHVFAGNLHGYYLNETMLLNFIADTGIKLVYFMFDEYPFLGKCAFTKGCEEFRNECKKCQRKKDYPQSLFFNTAHCLYNRKRRNYQKIADNCVFVAPEFEIKLALQSPLMKGMRTYVADEAIDTTFFMPRNVSSFKKKLGISENKFVCVCIALFNNIKHPKGAAYFIKLAESLKDESNYIFVHVGYLLKEKAFLPKNYIPIGFVHDQNELANYYSLADLFVLPAIAESMPNTCLEALSCGSPLLCFDYGGMSKIAPEDIATFVEPYNVDALKEAVLKTRKKDQSIINRCRNYAIERYDDQKYFGKVFEISETL